MKNIYNALKAKTIFVCLAVLFTVQISAQTDVLVCGAASPQSWLDDVQTKLIATGSFNSVATFNIYSNGTPTLAYLQTFDAVLVYTDYPASDPTTFGNNLAAYIDGGGGVVNATFSNASVLIGGNFNTSTYQVVIPNNGQNSSPMLTLGAIVDSCNPIMTNVNTFNGGSSSYRSTSSNFTAGSTVVSQWSNGEWLVAVRENVSTLNARRCDLNFYPPSSDVRSDFWLSSTNGGRLMANALLWVAGVINPVVLSAPVISAGPSTVCGGTTNTYSVNTIPGATSYTWTVPAGFVINSGQGTNTVSITAGTASGNIDVFASAGLCAGTSTSYLVTVNNATINANASATTVCSGDMVTLTGSGGVSYSWTGGASDGVPFAISATETFTVTGTDGNGCVDSSNVTINVNSLPVVTASTSNSAVCSGDSITLTGGGATSYNWSPGVITDGVAFTPASSDTYTVMGTDANGCMNTATVSVIVNQLPAVVAGATATSVCTGDSVTLSGSGATSYVWTGSVTNNVAFLPAATDTYTVTGTDANGCVNTASITVTVNALPDVDAFAVSDTVCNGDAAIIYGSGAMSYTWTGGVLDSISFVPLATGSYTVTGTDANGCMNTDSITITVNPLPVVSATALPSAEVCAGSSVTLNGTGAVTYSWTNSVTDGVPFTPAASDSYTVTGTDANGCMNTAEITIIVDPLPTVSGAASSTTVCTTDAAVTLTGTPAAGTWSGPGVTGTTFNPATAGAGTHTATYLFTDVNGCSSTATVTITVSLCTGVGENSATNGVNVFPNPNDGTFSITIGNSAENVLIELVDLEGRVVYSSSENNVPAGFTKQIETDNISAGLYLIRITTGSDQRIVKVAVQK
jgi:hypothetical protein